MCEVVALYIAPAILDLVQLGGIFRQPLDGQPVRSRRQRGAARLAGVDWSIIEHQHDWHADHSRPRSVTTAEFAQQVDEVAAALGPAGMDQQFAGRPIEHAQHRHLDRLARRRHAQVGPLLGPGMGEIGMRQRLRLIAEQQYDIAGFGLCLEQLAAQPGTVHRLGVLTALQRVPGAAPTEIPFLRSTTESREAEIRRPARCSICAAKRRNVQFVRFATGTDKTSSATASAASALTGDAPGGLCVRRPATPPCMNLMRHRRTVSSRTPKASPIRPLDQPATVSKMARARSASPRSCEPANACNCAWLSAVTATVLRPTISASSNLIAGQNHPSLPLASHPKPA